MSEAIAQKLDEARALIERGWCQGSYGSERRGVFCANGAIAKANGFDAELDIIPDLNPLPETQALCVALGFVESREVTDWNDAPGRTQAEVIDAFRKAAELARSESPNA